MFSSVVGFAAVPSQLLKFKGDAETHSGSLEGKKVTWDGTDAANAQQAHQESMRGMRAGLLQGPFTVTQDHPAISDAPGMNTRLLYLQQGSLKINHVNAKFFDVQG